MKATEKQLYASIKLHGGDIEKVAWQFSISRAAVYKRLNNSPLLLKASKDAQIEMKTGIIIKDPIPEKEDKRKYKKPTSPVPLPPPITTITTEELLDRAELGLQRLISEDDRYAIMFVLKTLGRSRGYSETDPVVKEDKDIRIIFNVEETKKEIGGMETVCNVDDVLDVKLEDKN